jgi:hypothetical protein
MGANGSLVVEFSASVRASAQNDLPIAGDADGTSSIQVDFTVVDNPVGFTISGESLITGSGQGTFHRAVQVSVSGGDYAFVDVCSEQECAGPTGTLDAGGVLPPGSYRLEAVVRQRGPDRDGSVRLESNATPPHLHDHVRRLRRVCGTGRSTPRLDSLVGLDGGRVGGGPGGGARAGRRGAPAPDPGRDEVEVAYR